ncbi:MAG TPA: hypothetical protein VJR89_37545, partial [Polyangiales bacterium]|nr:hypothetical protein [Polyangiales bacterium]
PSDWMEILERAILAAERCGRSLRQQLTLKLMLIQLPEISRPQPRVAREVVAQLERDSGLCDYAELAHVTPPELRMQQALTRATERWQATPPAERGWPPAEAIPELARVLIHIIGMMVPSMDQAFLSSLPSLAPYASLSPALRIVQRDVEGTCHLLGGRLAQAREQFLEIAAELAAPQDVGLTPAIRVYLELSVTYGLAMLETMLGLPDAAPRIDRLERDPFFEVGAWRLRFLRALSQGDATTADWCERKAELIKIRNPPTQFFQGADAWYETQAHVEVGDVARLHQVLGRLDAMAEKYPQWSGAALFARAHLARLRGDVQTALQLLEAALSKAQPGVITWYIVIARHYVLTLVEAGRAKDARKAGELHLRLAEEAGLITRLGELQHGLAAAALADGDLEASREHLDAADAVRERWPGAAVFGGACSELRARIALAARDPAAFDQAAEACAKAFLLSGNPILVARHQRLIQDAERAGIQPPTAARSARPGAEEQHTLEAEGSTQTTFQVSFVDCPDFEQRVARALWLATGQHASQHAMLYLVRDKLPVLVGQRGECPQPERFQSVVQRYFQSELEEQREELIDPDDLITSTVDNTAWTGPNGVPFAPALLSHKTRDGRALSGVFVFDLEGQHHPEDELLAALSSALTEAGDVEPVHVHGKPAAV